MDRIKRMGGFNSYEGGKPRKIETNEYETYIKEFAEEIFTQNGHIGDGQSADVFRDPLNQCCYKVITRASEALVSAEEEAEFLVDVQKNNSGVKIPMPLFSLEATVENENTRKLEKKGIVCMERIEGVSLEDITRGIKKLPENFDYESFFMKLEKFITEMNDDMKIFHRDLHKGNVMIDAETGEPCVIDFGLSKRTFLTDEDPYKTEIDIRNRMFTFKKDKEELAKMKSELKEFLQHERSIKTDNKIPDIKNVQSAFNKPERVNLKEVDLFNQGIEKAFNELILDKSNESQIDEGLGLWLVIPHTQEAKQRQQNKLILYPKIIQGQEFLICRN